jgi:hypothetical protein
MRGPAFAVLLFISIASGTYAQELISTAGDIFSGTSLQIEWSLGETMIDSYSEGHMLLTQGFHQPVLIPVDKPDTLVKIYPNPFDLSFFIDLTETESESNHFSIVLFDMSGRLVFAQDIFWGPNEIQTEDIPDGIYFLKLFDAKSNLLKSVKIIKLTQP